MSITRIADSVFFDIAVKERKKNYKTDASAPIESSFFQALHQNQYGSKENEQKNKEKDKDKEAQMEAWKEAQDNSHWFVDESIGKHINTVG